MRVEILRHAWLAKAVFTQKVSDACRLFEAQDRKPQHQCVDRDVGKRIETGRKEQKIGALIRELDLARRAQNFHLRPESRPLHLVGKIGRIGDLAFRVKSVADPDELESFSLRLVLDDRRALDEKINAFSQFDTAEADHQEFAVPLLWTQFSRQPDFLHQRFRGGAGSGGNDAFSLRRHMDGRARIEPEIRNCVFERHPGREHRLGRERENVGKRRAGARIGRELVN